MAYHVPVYEQPTVQSQPTPAARLSERYSPEDFGAGLGQNLEKAGMQVGNAASELEAKQQHLANITAVSKAETDLQATMNVDLDGDSSNPDPSKRVTGILQSQGDAAFQRASGYRKRWDDTRQQLMAGLANDAQRQQFDARSRRMVAASSASVEAHLGGQTAVVQDATTRADEGIAVQAIINRPFDDATYFNQVARVTSSIEEQARAQGFPAESPITRSRVQAFEGKALEGRIRQLIASPTPGAQEKAQALFTLGQQQGILGADSADLESRLSQNSYDVAGSSMAVGWVRGATNRVGRLDEPAVLKKLSDLEADPNTDPRLKKTVRENVEHQLRLGKARWDATVANSFDRAYTKIVAAGYDLNAAKDEKGFFLSPSVNEGKLWGALMDKVRNEQREKEGAPPTPDQQRAFTDFLFDLTDPAQRGKYGAMTSAQFAQEWAGKLGARDYHAAEGHVASLRLQLTKPDETLPPDVNQQLFAVAAGALGASKKVEPKKWPDAKREAYYHAYQDLLQKQQALKAQGKQLDQKTVQDTFNYWFQPGKVEGTGWIWPDTSTRAEAETNPDYAGKPFTPDLDATPKGKAQKEAFKKALEDADIMPDPDAVQWMYEKSLGLNPPRPTNLRIGVKKHRAQDELNNRLRVGTLQP